MGDECIPFLAPDNGLEVVEEIEALLVGDAGEGVVGVFAFEGGD